MGVLLIYSGLLHIISFTVYLFEGYWLQYFLNYFLQLKDKSWQIKSYVMGIVWFLIRVIYAELPQVNKSEQIIGKFVFSMLVLVLTAFYCYQGSQWVKIFFLMTFISVHKLVLFAAYSLLSVGSYLYQIPAGWIESGMTISPQKVYLIFSGIEVFLVILTNMIQCFLIYWAIKSILKSYRYRLDEFYKRELLYVTLPAFVGILVTILLRLLMVSVENGVQRTIYQAYPLLQLIIPMIAFTLLITIVVSFRLYQDMIGLHQEKSERLILENQIVQMQNSVLEMEHLNANIRSVKHDMKNNIAVLQTLLHQNQLDCDTENKELAQYFKAMCLSVERLDYRIQTGNPVSDGVINGKFIQAEKEILDIQLDASGFVFKDTEAIKSYDVGIILNNGLDNAIEACKRLKKSNVNSSTFISVKSFRKGKMFFIEIENSFDGLIKIDERDGYPLSLKEDKEIHGIGLRHIRNCAKKNFGDMDYFVDDGKFILSVMLKGGNE